MTTSDHSRDPRDLIALAALDHELAVSDSFRRWLLGAALAQVEASVCGASASELLWSEPGRRDGVDRVLFYDGDGGRVALVLALRRDAPMRAAAAVDAEGAAVIEDRRAAFAFTVLLGAGAAAERFDSVVALADVGGALAARAATLDGELARRLQHASGTFAAAASLARPSDAQQQTDAAERFAVEFAALIEDMAPTLRLGDAPAAPLEQLEFPAGALPRWPFMPAVRMTLYVRSGVAAIRFPGWGGAIEDLAGVMEPSLRGMDYMLASAPTGAPAATDALLIAQTNRLDPRRRLDAQFDAARECVITLRDLQRWYESRRAAARYWAEFCNPGREGSGNARILHDLRLS